MKLQYNLGPDSDPFTWKQKGSAHSKNADPVPIHNEFYTINPNAIPVSQAFS